jgi:hypothetical protein
METSEQNVMARLLVIPKIEFLRCLRTIGEVMEQVCEEACFEKN